MNVNSNALLNSNNQDRCGLQISNYWLFSGPSLIQGPQHCKIHEIKAQYHCLFTCHALCISANDHRILASFSDAEVPTSLDGHSTFQNDLVRFYCKFNQINDNALYKSQHKMSLSLMLMGSFNSNQWGGYSLKTLY